jgi:hypothetical protein
MTIFQNLVRYRNKIIGAFLAITLVGLLSMVVFTLGSRTNLPPSDQSKIRNKWALTGDYTEIADTPEFRGAISTKVAAMVGVPRGISGRGPEAADIFTKFLFAYSRGSFEEFMKFRSPTGEFEVKQFAEQNLMKAIQDINKYNAACGLADRVTVAEPANFRGTWHQFWDEIDKIVQSDRSKIPARLRKFPLPCTRCLSAVMVSDLTVEDLPGGELPDLVQIVRARERIGAYVQKGIITLRPDAKAARSANAGTPFLLCTAMVRLSSGNKSPVYLVAYWDDQGKRFLPFSVGSGDGTQYGAKFLF